LPISRALTSPARTMTAAIASPASTIPNGSSECGVQASGIPGPDLFFDVRDGLGGTLKGV
jgi:hypothetical protein